MGDVDRFDKAVFLRQRYLDAKQRAAEYSQDKQSFLPLLRAPAVLRSMRLDVGRNLPDTLTVEHQTALDLRRATKQERSYSLPAPCLSECLTPVPL